MNWTDVLEQTGIQDVCECTFAEGTDGKGQKYADN